MGLLAGEDHWLGLSDVGGHGHNYTDGTAVDYYRTGYLEDENYPPAQGWRYSGGAWHDRHIVAGYTNLFKVCV